MAGKFDWNSEETWPFDGQDKIFLTRAMAKLGRHLMFDEWSDEVAHAASPDLPESLQGATTLQVETAASLLVPEPSRNLVKDVLGQWQFQYALDDSEWSAARQVREKLAQRFQAFKAVQLAMREHCAEKRLRSFAMRADTSFQPIPADLWIDRRFEFWFETGRLSRVDIEPQITLFSQPEYWLYFSLEDLERIIGKSANGARETRNYPDLRIDEELRVLYNKIENGILEKPNREGLVEMMCEQLPGVQKDKVKRRHAAIKPQWWKPGQGSIGSPCR